MSDQHPEPPEVPGGGTGGTPPPGPPSGPPSYPGDSGGLPPYGGPTSGGGWGGTPPPPGGGWGGPPPPPGGGWSGGPDNAPFDATAAIAYGWNKFRQDVGPWLLAGAIILAVSIAMGVATEIFTPSDDLLGDSPVFTVSFSFLSILLNLVSTVVGWILSAGLYRGALDVTEGRRFDFFDAFKRIDLVKVVLTSLLVGVGTVVGLMLCLLPGLVFMFFSYFAILFVVDRQESPVQAIGSSFRLVKDNLGSALLLAVLSVLVVLAGFLACCVGLFVAIPIVTLASAYAYKKFLGQGVTA